jgi:carbon monoxide dehydrogenase subunit G
MRLSGSYTLHSPRAQVWPLIQDPASLVRLIPGCEQLEQISPTEYRGQMQIPVAAVAGTYSTYVRLLNDPEPYLTRFEGEMNGPAGAMRGQAWFRLDAAEDAATSILTYEGQGIISGPLGRMDGRFTESVAHSLLNQGLANVDRQLQESAAGIMLAPVAAHPCAARHRTITRWGTSVSHFFSQLSTHIRSLFSKRFR